MRKVYITSRFAIPIIFTANPYSGFSTCRVFEIQMWFGAFASCINRGDGLLDIFVNAFRYYNSFRYKRTLILLVTMFIISMNLRHFLRGERVKKYREIGSRLVRLPILRINVQYGVISWWRTWLYFPHTALARKNHEKLFLSHLEVKPEAGIQVSNLLG